MPLWYATDPKLPIFERILPPQSRDKGLTDLGFSEGATWSLLLLNHDFTSMEFVVNVIEQFFDMNHESAMHLMLRVYYNGSADV